MRKRCVITGIGAVSAAGVGIEETWESLCAGTSAICPVIAFDASAFDCPFAGEVAQDGSLVSAKNHVPKSYRKATKVMARDTELAVIAASLAAKDASLITREAGEDAELTYPSGRVGCHIGAGFIAAETNELTSALVTAKDESGEFSLEKWGESGIGNLQPLWLLKYLPNMLACHVTIIHGCEGPSNTITCAEASGLLSVSESVRIIERGDAEVCFSGGIENKVNPMGMARMTKVGRFAPMSADETKPWQHVRPYAEEAEGAVPGEGGGIVIVEELESAKNRGVRAYAEIAGAGSAQSPAWSIGVGTPVEGAGHPPEGADEGLVNAIAGALRDAGLTAGDIDAIVPGAFAVRPMDHAEIGALEAVFGERLREIPLVTLTPAVGQLFSGAGSLGLAVGAKALFEQKLPARLSAGKVDIRVSAGAADARDQSLEHVLVCTSSLSGQAACVILKKAEG